MNSRQRLMVLTFHRVLQEPDPLRPGEPTVPEFRHIVQAIARWCTPMTLADALCRRANGTLPPRATVVTFDDGYRDNLTLALPELQRCGVPATVFVATGACEDGILWNDRVLEACARGTRFPPDWSKLGLMGDLPVPPAAADGPRARVTAARALLQLLKALPLARRIAVIDRVVAELAPSGGLPRLMMDRGDLEALAAAGVELGAHTVNHPILACEEEAVAAEEVLASRRWLQETLGVPAETFAYPNGRAGRDFSPANVDAVRNAGFLGAVTTTWGIAGPADDAFLLPRAGVWGRTAARASLRLLRTWYGF